jgi:polysaccharide export outer membrane protein
MSSRGVRLAILVSLICLGTCEAWCQPQSQVAGPSESSDPLRPNYKLGPNDQIMIRVPQSEEINDKPFRLDPDGFLDLPLVGRLRAAGLSVKELEAELVRRLRQYVLEPQVTITVVGFRAEPVFFIGAFKSPGIYPLQGRRTLVEMISNVAGLLPYASRRIKLTRRAEYGVIPISGAVEAPDKKTSTIEISMDALRNNVNPAEDILLEPFDTISVERLEPVYVSGEVAKVGAIDLGERDSISVAQALTLSGGFARDAVRSKVRILRPILNTTRRAEIDVDLTHLYEGKGNDIPLLPNDLLYVPRNTTRSFLTQLGTNFVAGIPYIIITALLR